MNDKLLQIVEESNLETTKADYILNNFKDYFKIASEWEGKAKAIKVTDASQVAEMKMAKEGRLYLKQKRVDVEKARKKLKEQSLCEGKTIDGIANVLKGLIQPIEGYLSDQENFIKVQEEKRRIERKARRIELIKSRGLNPDDFFNETLMVDNDLLFADIVKAREERKKQEQQEAEERLKRVQEENKAREAQRLENERLKKESAKKDAALAKERKAREDAERVIKEKEQKEKAAQEAKAKAEKEAEENAKNADDKTKLEELKRGISEIECPEVESVSAQALIEAVVKRMFQIVELIDEELNH